MPAALLLATLALGFQGSLFDVDAKVASVLPTAEEEKWLTIPWRTNLFGARKEASEKGLPIFMWMMNGHPMGCT